MSWMDPSFTSAACAKPCACRTASSTAFVPCLVGQLGEFRHAEMHAGDIGRALIQDLAHERAQTREVAELDPDHIARVVAVRFLPRRPVGVAHGLVVRRQIDGGGLDVPLGHAEAFREIDDLAGNHRFWSSAVVGDAGPSSRCRPAPSRRRVRPRPWPAQRDSHLPFATPWAKAGTARTADSNTTTVTSGATNKIMTDSLR